MLYILLLLLLFSCILCIIFLLLLLLLLFTPQPTCVLWHVLQILYVHLFIFQYFHRFYFIYHCKYHIKVVLNRYFVIFYIICIFRLKQYFNDRVFYMNSCNLMKKSRDTIWHFFTFTFFVYIFFLRIFHLTATIVFFSRAFQVFFRCLKKHMWSKDVDHLCLCTYLRLCM